MREKRQLLFVQGGSKGAHDEWDSKLVASLRRELGQEYEIHYPRMPREAEPSYALWKTALEKSLSTLRDGAILIGHSVGGTILVKVLTEQSAPKFGAFFFISAIWALSSSLFLRSSGVRSRFSRRVIERTLRSSDSSLPSCL